MLSRSLSRANLAKSSVTLMQKAAPIIFRPAQQFYQLIKFLSVAL